MTNARCTTKMDKFISIAVHYLLIRNS